MRYWPMLTVEVPDGVDAESWEIFCAHVCEDGPTGYEERDPRPDGVPRQAVFYYPAVEQPDDSAAMAHASAMAEAADAHLPGAMVAISAETVEDQDWAAAWRGHYRLTHASPRVYTAPPEDAQLPPDAPDDAVLVVLDDVRPFGDGGHASTRGCLALVEAMGPQCRSLLDIGAGTGVLCFAALKLGYEDAVGMDREAAAAEAFAANAKLNGLSDRALFVRGSTIDEAVAGMLMAGRAIPDLLVCNMLSIEFDGLLEPMARLRRPLVLGGFLEAEAEAVRARLGEAGWRVAREGSFVEWCAWLCEPVEPGAAGREIASA